jgi:hypothetical protein
MHFELWALSTGNRIAAMATEADALALVRELIEIGWDAEELSLGPEPDAEAEYANLPPVVEGAALKELAYQRV